jgi:hypothetical protein
VIVNSELLQLLFKEIRLLNFSEFELFGNETFPVTTGISYFPVAGR